MIKYNCFLFTLLCCHYATPAQQQTPPAYLDTAARNFMHTLNAGGLSIGIVTAGKTASYHFGAPTAGNVPSASTLYEIGSITKTFASTLLAHAVLAHKIRLDDDIRRYLPGQFPNLEYQGKPIRIVHLANLTSGLPNWLPDKPELFQDTPPDSIASALIRLHEHYSRSDFYNDLRQVHLTAMPGDHPRHSNVAAQLLGYILETVYHKPFPTLVAEYITRPLQMNQTSFAPVKSPDLAKGYNAKGIAMPYTDLKDLLPSGGLVSSTNDMLKFIRYQLNETNKAVALSHSITVRNKQGTVALNWHIDGAGTDQAQIWHTGGTFGFSSYLVLLPKQQAGVILMASECDPDTQNRLVKIAQEIIAHLGSGTRTND